jgi:P27 family predicted phage terminase small subunit
MPNHKSAPKNLKEVAAVQQRALLESDETRPQSEEIKPQRILECPPELGPQARLEWERIAGELIKLGILSSFDRGPLAAYCCAYALWVEAMEMVQKHGAMIKSPNGYPVQSPYLSHANRQFEIMMKIATEFGFTPASRARIFTYSQKNSMLLEAVDETDDGSAW